MGKYRLVHDRLFVAVPEFEYKGYIILGASVGILFRFFKDDKEVFFDEGSSCDVCDNVICSFDKTSDDCCVLTLKPYLVETWFDRMSFEIIDWELMVFQGLTRDIFPACPEGLGFYPISEGVRVGKEEFVNVLREHWESFYVSDNLEAKNLC